MVRFGRRTRTRMLTAPSFPEFVCPRCRGALSGDRNAYHCAPCAAEYPIVLGIPDFRVEPDPWIGLEADREKARRVVAASEGEDLATSVAAYWAMTPGTPPALASRFTAHVVAGERRATEWLDMVDRTAHVAASGPWLEIGCASGDLLAACAARGVPAVGVDVAMRWLVLARRRPALASGAQRLICANGEALPFRDGCFARVVSVGTLEHCQRADVVVSESARVLAAGGDAWVRTTNRFSLLPEPHVGVWGVGLVPRRWADAYVRWWSGERYLHHRPLSAREISRAMRRAGFGDVAVTPASMLSSDRDRLGPAGRRIAPIYAWARRVPAVAAGLAQIAPLLDASGMAPGRSHATRASLTPAPLTRDPR